MSQITELNKAMTACILNCWSCRTLCQTTLVNHCLSMGGAHVEQQHVKLMLDCIQACQTCADFMTRGSALHAQICRACASVCEACAVSCEKIKSPEMLACAQACRACVTSCADMSVMNMAS